MHVTEAHVESGPSPIYVSDARKRLLDGLNPEQVAAVKSDKRKLLIVAGAGSGKTEVMSRRVAWWLAVDGVPRERVVAFTFTEAAAEELKFRIRRRLEDLVLPGQAPMLDGMYIGTIHGFCLKKLREFAPDEYYSYDVCDELTRFSLVQRSANFIIGLSALKAALSSGGRQFGLYETTRIFLRAYDLLHEYDVFSVAMPPESVPSDVALEKEWCKEAILLTNVGKTPTAKAFAVSAARFYAYLRARRFLDFASSQSELTRLVRGSPALQKQLQDAAIHLVVDEVQDINPVQREIIRQFVGDHGKLTAVGDHRQAIYGFRGGRIELMGQLAAELDKADDGNTLSLPTNYRSTPRIVELANRWSSTIGLIPGLTNPPMLHGNALRKDQHRRHVSIADFPTRADEASWIVEGIRTLVPSNELGANHDDRTKTRGLTYADVAILVRSGSGVREYQEALAKCGIPAVVRAGADLFAQPEVLLFLACFAKAGGTDSFMGREIVDGIRNTLKCDPKPDFVIDAAARYLRQRGIPLERDAEKRLKLLATAIAVRLSDKTKTPAKIPDVSSLRSVEARSWCCKADRPRRVFPQTLLHWFFSEAGVSSWDDGDPIKQSAMFHIGQLSGLVKGLETPGWTNPSDFKFQVLALINWGAKSARPEDAPLLVAPNAVTVATVHGSKGLEFPAVFLADVNSRRFPSSRSRIAPDLPFDGPILKTIDPTDLADNQNYDAERRLMYVAITRAERFLFISCSGQARSNFYKDLEPLVASVSGTVGSDVSKFAKTIKAEPSSRRRDDRLVTSFSDLRFYLECPHDFYLRKVLGFAPAIDQAFGYGRAVHNMLRQIHTEPKSWAKLKPAQLRSRLERLVQTPGFYLRYTTGEPLENMRGAAVAGLERYVNSFRDELATLTFEPEREFETLVADENVMITGAIDLVRLDAPPRVTIVDFKSGSAGSGDGKLSESMMKLQLGIYGVAAASELQYEPERGQIRFLGEKSPDKSQIEIDLTDGSLQEARQAVISSAAAIRKRRFFDGPTSGLDHRCGDCDHANVCGIKRGAAP